MINKRDQKKERRTRETLYEKYGYLIGVPTLELPEEQRSPNGGLRCFKRISPRDDHGNKIITEKRKRCKNTCAKGSLYCRHHGGANSKALVHGNRISKTLEIYRGVHNTEFQDYMQAFMDDPQLMDMRAELVTVRSIMLNYMKKIAEGEKAPKNSKGMMKRIENIVEDGEMSSHEKLVTIKEITDSIRSLDDGIVVDRINRCVETVGKTIERISKLTNKDEFMLTPEGLKIMLRAILDIIKKNVEGEAELRAIRKDLKCVSVKTGGDLSKYRAQTIDAEIIDAS